MIWRLLILLLVSCATTKVVEVQPIRPDLTKLLANSR